MLTTSFRALVTVLLLTLVSGTLAAEPADKPRTSLKVAKHFDLSGSSEDGWNDCLKKLSEKGLPVPIFVIAQTHVKDAKGKISESFRTVLGTKADLTGLAGSTLGKTTGAPVSLRQGSIHTRTGSGKGTPYDVDISEERFAPNTMYSMHHYENVVIIDLEEDEGTKTWKAKVDLLAKPLTRADYVRLF